MSIPSFGSGGDMALGDSDSSSQTSGNIGGSSADRISKQFISVGGGGNNLDLNSFLNGSSAGFYNAIAGEQKLESGIMGSAGGAFKYVALGSGVLIALIAVIAMKGRK